jgi:hypothetical protein
MIFAIPIAGKILAGLAASEVGAAPPTQETDPQKLSGAANAIDFTQTVDDLDRASGAAANLHGAHAAAKS